ncbi:MAG: HEPN domain-containing protein [Leptospiraceae bacterium]|nr:HEPN domain-containing protein [Leptospiraceae bacterium]MCP5494102.1 HEPN domain-containing protein [Leptospiraceae bacterium]
MNENQPEWKTWLKYAEEDLNSAIALSKTMEQFPRNVCYLCQQSTEKAIKSIFVFFNIPFPRKHDLELLYDNLPEECKRKIYLEGLSDLTEWAIEIRYPGETPLPEETEMNEAIQFAKKNYSTIISYLETE